jgi:hypothetical protein
VTSESDRVGEKLSEGFVGSVLSQLFGQYPPQPFFALLAPERANGVLHYNLYASRTLPACAGKLLDDHLKQNPQYAYARALGQLSQARIVSVPADAYESYARRLSALGQRMGDVKPVALSPLDDWLEYLTE